MQVWRVRYYDTEKILGAAKPLVFLKQKLVLPKGQCKRLL